MQTFNNFSMTTHVFVSLMRSTWWSRYSSKETTPLPTHWTCRIYFCKQWLFDRRTTWSLASVESSEAKACRLLHDRGRKWYLCFFHIILSSHDSKWLAVQWKKTMDNAAVRTGQEARDLKARFWNLIINGHPLQHVRSLSISTYKITGTKPNWANLSHLLTSHLVLQNPLQWWPSWPSSYLIWLYEWDFIQNDHQLLQTLHGYWSLIVSYSIK
jgi:hypothetical protein